LVPVYVFQTISVRCINWHQLTNYSY